MNCCDRISVAVLLLALLSTACTSGDTEKAEIDVPYSDEALIDTWQNPVTTAADGYGQNGYGQNTVSDLATPSTLPALSEQELSEYLKTVGLEGMYDWAPAGGFPDAVWQGTLVASPPCVFIDLSTADTAKVSRSTDDARVFLRLSEPLTRYEYDSAAIWVGDDGPMSSGDLVEVVGSAGRPIERNAESAELYDFAPWAAWGRGCHAHGSFWVASLRPLSQNHGERLTDREPLAGLFPYHVGMAHPDIGVDMVLHIEPPCVFVVPIPVWESREANSLIQHRYFLRLPRPLVRFDADSNSLWVGEDGPVTTGDYVGINDHFQKSENGLEFYEGGCSARGSYQSSWLQQITGLRLQDLDCIDQARQYQDVIPLAPCARLPEYGDWGNG